MNFFAHVIIFSAATSLGLAVTSCPHTAEDATALFQAGVNLHLGASRASNSVQNTAARPPAENTAENALQKEADEVLKIVSQSETKLGDSRASSSVQNTVARPPAENTVKKEHQELHAALKAKKEADQVDQVLKIVSQSETALGDKATGFEPRESANSASQLDSSSLAWATGYAKAASKSSMKLVGKADIDGNGDDNGDDEVKKANADDDAEADAESKPHHFSLCGGADPKILGITELDSPDPAYAGTHVALTTRGVAGKRIEKASAKLVVSSMGMEVGAITFDFCKNVGVTCPVEEGDHWAATLRYALPDYPVPGSAPCRGRVTLTSEGGEHGDLGCIVNDIMVASNGTMPWR